MYICVPFLFLGNYIHRPIFAQVLEQIDTRLSVTLPFPRYFHVVQLLNSAGDPFISPRKSKELNLALLEKKSKASMKPLPMYQSTHD